MGPELVLHSSQGERRSKIGSYKKALPKRRQVAYQNTRQQKTDSSNQDLTTREKAQGRLARSKPRPAVNTHPTPKWHHVSNHKPRLHDGNPLEARRSTRTRNAPRARLPKGPPHLAGKAAWPTARSRIKPSLWFDDSTQEAPREQPHLGRDQSRTRAGLTKERLQAPLHPQHGEFESTLSPGNKRVVFESTDISP